MRGYELDDPEAVTVRTHPFFGSLDWDALYRKEYRSPYDPSLKQVHHRAARHTCQVQNTSETPSPQPQRP